MTLTMVIIFAVLALLLEGFFSGSEIALVSSDRVELENLARKGSRGAKLALNFLDNSSEFLSTTLLGTNLAVVSNTVVVTLYLLDHHGSAAELLSVAVVSPLVLLFGEIIPKSVFQQHAVRIAPKAVYVLYAFRLLFYPFVFLLSLLSKTASDLVGVERSRAISLSREDLRMLIEEAAYTLDSSRMITALRLNLIREGEQRIVTNILKLKDVTAEELMVPLSEVISVPKTATVQDALEMVEEHGYTRLPVFEKRVDAIVGVIHSFDLLNQPLERRVSELMQPVIFVPETEGAFRILVDLQHARKGMAVVVNEYGGAEGIVTIEDVLEEIVGEIEDEFDEPEEDETIQSVGPGVWRVSGRVPVERLNAELRISIPDDPEYETIAGYVLDRLRRMPTVGDRVKEGGLELEVTSMSDRAILEVEIRKLPSGRTAK